MKNTFFCAALLGLSGLLPYAVMAAETVRTEFEKHFIGREWKDDMPDLNRYPISSQCMFESGQVLQQDKKLTLDNFICTNGRLLSLIGQRADPDKKVSKVLDAFLFPKPKEGEKLMFTGDCSLNGSTQTDFTALVRMGDHESVDWQTGVIAAWLPNVKTQKYEPLSTRHIVCDVPTPP